MKNGMILFYDWIDALEELTDEERGKLVLAMLKYHRDGTPPPEFQGIVKMAANFIFPTLDRSKTYAENGRKGGLKTNASSNASSNALSNASSIDKTKQDKTKPKQEDNGSARPSRTKRNFVKPSADEISEYCSECGLQVDAQRFLDYYESNGWMVGKNPMKDWKAACRSWAHRSNNEPLSGSVQSRNGEGTQSSYGDGWDMIFNMAYGNGNNQEGGQS